MASPHRPNNAPYIALVLLLLGAAAYVLYRIYNPPVRVDPWVQYLTVPAAFPLPAAEDARALVMQFNAGEYEAVTQTAPLLLAADSVALMPELRYLLGVGYLKTREAYPAIYQLEKVPRAHPLRASADYYRAVAYYLSGNRNKARLILADVVSDPAHPEAARAGALLEEFW